ncbi:MAG: glycosyltransferase family 4 protein [Candidatus Eisenbacteria bacterium]
MNVLALVSHPVAGPSTRYRVLQFEPVLAARGIRLHVEPLFGAAAFDRLYRAGGRATKGLGLLAAGMRRMSAVLAAHRYDAVLVLREVWPLHGLLHELVLRQRNPRWVFDLDDAVWLPNVSAANRGFAFLKAPEKARWIVGQARAVSAGNRFIASWAGERTRPDARVFHVPTAVDTARFRPAGRPRTEGPIRLGWIGSLSTAPYLESIARPLARLSARHKGLTLRVIGARIELPGVEVECVPWSLEGEVRALDETDIALAPLPDNDWSRGKCGLKVLQSMALAKPVVTSPIGAHLDLVEDGVDGRFAAGDDAWFDAIDGLIADPAARTSLGAAGRATVERRYSIEAVAPALEAALRHAAGSP